MTYQYSWDPAIWSKYYSEGPEIFAYFKGVVDKFKLWRHIKLQHQVTYAKWDEEDGCWNVRITNLATNESFDDTCDVLVNAMGFLKYVKSSGPSTNPILIITSNWKWPNITGLHSFKGTLTHSANWPSELSLKGKRVAIIGNGSSGIQLVAHAQKQVSKLYTWVRTPTWMTAGFAQKYAGENGANFECEYA